MLGNLDQWLADALEFAEGRGVDPEQYLDVRLYPDQFGLRRQVQSACDTAKMTCALLAGIEWPKHEDGPQSLAELRARLASVRAFITELDAIAIDAGAAREISPGFARGMVIDGAAYAREFGVPNFYFHTVTAYAILRSIGVPLGKIRFIGSMSLRPPAEPAEI